MFKNKKVIVVMPAYNAAQTLRNTHDEVMAQDVVDLVIIVDDASNDETTAVAATLPNTVVHTHPSNLVSLSAMYHAVSPSVVSILSSGNCSNLLISSFSINLCVLRSTS